MRAFLVLSLWVASACAATIEPPAAARRLARGEAACVKCHPTVVAQWRQSAHRHASLDNPWYRGALRAFEAARPGQATFCGGCHDPALVAAGTLTADAEGPAARAGVGCLTCHSITRAPLEGNGAWHAEVTPVPTKGAAHVERVKVEAPLRLCASCHKVGLTEAVTTAHWQRGQNQYDAWYDSAWAGRGVDVVLRPGRQASCLDCHMPKVLAGADEKGAEAGRVRDHRFVGGHGALPALFGHPEQAAAVAARLTGIIDLDLRSARRDHLDVVLRNVGVGHPFPGGTQDAKQVWLEATVRDAKGAVIDTWGHLGEDGRVPEDAWLFRAHLVDGEGRPVTGRAAWTQRGKVADTRLPPGAPRVVRYALPEGAARVEVRLRFRRFGLDDLALLCAQAADPAACKAVPVVTLASAAAPVVDGRLPAADQWRRLVAHGLGLTFGLPHHVADAEPLLRAAATAAPDRVEPVLALARLAWVQGRTDDVVRLLGALEAPPAQAWWIQANALTRAFRHGPALAAAERLVAAVPDDRRSLALLARLQTLNDQPARALETADRLLAIDPESGEGWFQRMLALRELGRPSDQARAAWLRFRRRDELDRQLRDRFRTQVPGRAAVVHGVGPD